MLDTIDLTKNLVARASVTPDDAGCQELLAHTLAPFGFSAQHFPFGEVKNILLTRGSGQPHFLFVGHTDVVPPGDLTRWLHPPFHPTIHEDNLYGRGVADMKGCIASFVTACARFVTHYPEHRGRLSILLTSDEEGPSLDGVRKIAERWQAEGEKIDWCLVGEPTSEHFLGDVIKIGRRGSLTGTLTIHGKQGHIAYPQLAKNPIPLALPFLQTLVHTKWDEGNDHFQPTALQIASIQAGAGAANIIPGQLQIIFNFRYAPEQTVEKLQEQVAALLAQHELSYDLHWAWSGLPYYTSPGEFIDNVTQAITETVGTPPQLTTHGGTSDGRFIAPLGAQVVEFGLINRSIHQVNEHVALKDLEKLSEIYEAILVKLL